MGSRDVGPASVVLHKHPVNHKSAPLVWCHLNTHTCRLISAINLILGGLGQSYLVVAIGLTQDREGVLSNWPMTDDRLVLASPITSMMVIAIDGIMCEWVRPCKVDQSNVSRFDLHSTRTPYVRHSCEPVLSVSVSWSHSIGMTAPVLHPLRMQN